MIVALNVRNAFNSAYCKLIRNSLANIVILAYRSYCQQLFLQELSLVYRKTALKVFAAFKTAPNCTAFVILGMVPIDIVADEIRNIYNIKFISYLSQAKNGEKERSVSRWHEGTRTYLNYSIVQTAMESQRT